MSETIFRKIFAPKRMWLFILLFHSYSPTAQATIDSNDLMVGIRIDMLQVPRHYQAISFDSQYNRGLWTIDDARSVLARYHQGEFKDDEVRALTVKAETEVNFSDHLFVQVWEKHWGGTHIYPLFESNGIVDYAPDFGYRHDTKEGISFFGAKRSSQQVERNFNNENDFIFLATGYLVVPEAGQYSIGILNDDGFLFQFDLLNGSSFVMADSHLQPLHPPQFFSKKVNLVKGMYPISLLSFEHLEASIIRLSWQRPSAKKFEVIPSQFFRVR